MFSVRALVGYCIDTFHKDNLLTPANNTNVTQTLLWGVYVCVCIYIKFKWQLTFLASIGDFRANVPENAKEKTPL
jgi:hypothetical protein